MLSDKKVVNRITLFSIISLMLVSNIVYFSHQQRTHEYKELQKSTEIRASNPYVVEGTNYHPHITAGTQLLDYEERKHSSHILISDPLIPQEKRIDFDGSYSYSFSYEFSFSYENSDPPLKTTDGLCYDVHDWTDRQGIDCEMYSKWNLCTKNGDYGVGYIYDPVIAPFSAWSNAGLDATQACCACGGGDVADYACSDSMCLACTTSSVCTSCVEGYYVNAEKSCSSCTDDQCLTCTDQNTCTSCDVGFYVDSLNSCSSCSLAMPDCMYCADSSTCTDCKWGSYVTPEGACANCQDAIPNCTFCTDSQTCTLCDAGYNVDPFYQCSEIESPCDRHCYDGYCDINTGHCSLCMENFAPAQNGECVHQEELGCDSSCNDCRHTCMKKNGIEFCAFVCHSCENGYKLSSEKVCIQDSPALCVWFHKDGEVCKEDVSGVQDTCSACRSKLSKHCHHFTWDGLEECESVSSHKIRSVQLEESLVYIHSKWAMLFSSTSLGTLVLVITVPVVAVVLFLRSRKAQDFWNGCHVGYQPIP